jgi:predicted phosphodiesterase
MKIGILSDIHGNIYSFERIYRQLIKERCDLHLFLGDICGYYYRQQEVMTLLLELPHLQALAGNHDRLFLESLEDTDVMNKYTGTYGLSFKIFKETITPDHLAFLKRLPGEYYLKEEGIAAFHGSPWNPLREYIYPDSPMERFESLPFKAVFLGHTHYPMDIKLKSIRVVNPGSAGQPRDGGWPSYALYDTCTHRLDIKAVPYNVNALVQEIKERGHENAYLIQVLHRIKGWRN